MLSQIDALAPARPPPAKKPTADLLAYLPSRRSRHRRLRDLPFFDDLPEISCQLAIVTGKHLKKVSLGPVSRLPSPLVALGGLDLILLGFGLKISHHGTTPRGVMQPTVVSWHMPGSKRWRRQGDFAARGPDRSAHPKPSRMPPASRRQFRRRVYSTETRTTPECIMPRARAALIDTSITRPRTNGPRSLTRQWMEWPAWETVTTLPRGRVR
jgi:hypothetical protein